ncbi:hypothetical protein SUGI_0686640 [Cryptomeria japonica]|nr:hypothetical protein SUGI_0686640 [Cryptomeria japonica]
MFLDATCFLIGEETSVPVAVWDGSGWSGVHGLERPVEKCLVEVHKENATFFDDKHRETIRMHDHLRDIGREIASTHSPCRYWSRHQIQINSQATAPIRGINSGTLNLQYCLEKLVGSKILLVSEIELTEEIVSLSEDLVWLRWDRFRHRNLPSGVQFTNLVVLQVYSANLEELWRDNVNPPLKLMELNISSKSALQKLPPSIGRLKQLKRIILHNMTSHGFPCINLPEEFCDLQALEYMVISSSNLQSLPDRFGELKNLRHIDLRFCAELKILPISFKNLIHLEFLDLYDCNKLKLRSDMLENIKKLEILDLGCCKKVEELPSKITSQVSLKRLTAHRTSLRYLPDDIGLLPKLKSLTIGSDMLTNIPLSVGNLSSLTDLSIGGNRLSSLPSSLSKLSCLTNLGITCPQLTSLPSSNLSCLSILSVQSRMLTILPFTAGDFALHKLENIELSSTGTSPPDEDRRVFGSVQPVLNTEFPYLSVRRFEEVFDCSELQNFLCYLIEDKEEEDEEENYSAVDEDDMYYSEDEEDNYSMKDEEENYSQENEKDNYSTKDEEENYSQENEDNYSEDDEEEYYCEEGAFVHMAVFRQAPEYVVARYVKWISSNHRSKAMVLAGEEAKVGEAFYKILSLLE